MKLNLNRLKTSKNDKVAVAGIIVVGGAAGFTIYKKKKSKRNTKKETLNRLNRNH